MSPSSASSETVATAHRHMFGPLGLNPLRTLFITLQDPLHVLVDRHLPAKEAFQLDQLGLECARRALRISSKDVADASPSNRCAVINDEAEGNAWGARAGNGWRVWGREPMADRVGSFNKG